MAGAEGLMGYLIVFAGAGLGGALRHGVNLASARLFGVGFPYGTMIVNIVGSLAMGLLAGYFVARTGIPQHVRLFVTTGVLGGFTTFSAFSLDAVLLIERHAYWSAAAYMLGSVILSLVALFAGLGLFRIGAPLP
jgi:CrcB protein